jgi:hypothetical protein
MNLYFFWLSQAFAFDCFFSRSYESEGGGDYEVLHLKIDTVEGHAKGVEVKVTGLPAGYPAIDAAGFLFLQVRGLKLTSVVP